MIPFVKTQACGNDFLIIEEQFAPADRSSAARRLCNRNFGIGADGIEWVAQGEGTVRAALSNADGSEAEISGNGTRCVAAWHAKVTNAKRVLVHTGAGLKECRILSRSANSAVVEMAMGTPSLGETVSCGSKAITVNVGNPHCVVFVEDFAEGWEQWAAEISHDPQFTAGCNVELVRVLTPDAIEFRIYERGVGPTLSSGTGSCAAALAAMAARAMPRDLRVVSLGGEQRVRWGAQVMLTGPAEILAQGEAFL